MAPRKGPFRIGAVTIGQSPRTDVADEFLAAVNADVLLVQKGALDGLSLAEIAALAPVGDDPILVTRLRDGTEVRVSGRLVDALLEERLRELEAEGVGCIALFCTGAFPTLRSKALLLKPDILLSKVVDAVLAGAGRATGSREPVLGVVCPGADQIPEVAAKWARPGLSVVCAAASPYSGDPGRFARAAAVLAPANPDLVVLDCIGYTELMRRSVAEAIGAPILVPRALLGRVAGALVGGMRWI